jgi:signal transduction histidine kinase
MAGAQLETHFAPAVRTAPSELERRIGVLTNNPITDTLLQAVGGLVAILDENRQILAVNQAFLDGLGCADPASVMGLRPGEALGCIHADAMPAGCGTSPHCATCGAVVSIVTALADDAADERTCVAEVRRDGGISDLVLRVRACPIDLGGERILMLVLQDATDEQRLAALEQAFYHDVNNVVQALMVAADLVGDDVDDKERRQLAARIARLVEQLNREIQLQKSLHGDAPGVLDVPLDEVVVNDVLGELRRTFLHHPAAAGKTIAVRSAEPGVEVRTDLWLLVRVLTNLVVNALEATEPGGRVEVAAEYAGGAVTFHVRNPAAIPREIQPRIFQKNFTTKSGSGHGLGAWSARMFAERLLGGDVSFTSSDRYGTDFQVRLPY